MKNFFYIVIFLILLTNKLHSETFNKINVIGNNRISEETIILFGGIDLKKDYNSNDLNNILKELYSTDFFKKVEINIKNNNLNITVVENPIM